MTDRPAREIALHRAPTRASHRPIGARERALFANFYRRELTLRYLGSTTGFAWALVHPLVLLGVYHFVFTSIFHATGFAGQSFLAFVAVALWPWLAAQESMQRGTISIAGYSGMIRKVAFPHEIVVYASVAATFTLQLIGYLVVLGVLKASGEAIHLRGLLIALPVWAIVLVGVTGVVLFLSALQVFIRDIEHILMPLLMILMYLTPVLYPLTLVPASLRPWVALNPFSWMVGRLRDALLEGRLALQWADVAAVVVAVAVFAGGLAVFRRLSPHFEDFI